MRCILAVTTLVAASISPLFADCRDAVGNLLANANCGFDSEVAPWQAGPGNSIEWVTTEPGQGVLKAPADPGGSLTVDGPCVEARAGTEHDIRVRLRASAGTAYFCSLNVTQFSDASCTEGEDSLGSAGLPPGDDWTEASGSAETAASARSLRPWLACSGEPR